MHIWFDDAPLEETLSALDTAVASGRASYVGVSNYSGWQTAQAATWQRAVPGRAPLASTQMEYSLLNRTIEHEVLPAAQALGLGVLPWSPLGRGVLTGKYRTGTPADSRAASSHFASFVNPYLGPRSQQVVEAVAQAADGLGWSALEVALAWVRDRPGVTAPIVGARTAPQLRGALGVEELTLPEEIRTALDDVSAGGTRGRRVSVSRALRRPPARGVEWEFDKVTFSRDFSRTVVTKLLVERAEHGGWELDRVRIAPDGTRRVVLRRKIIRVRPTLF